MKYGLTIDSQLICDPIADHARLVDIAARQGFPVDDIQQPLTGTVEVTVAGKALQILPGIEERPAPPAPQGYGGRLTGWSIDQAGKRLVRTVEYSPLTPDQFSDELKTAITNHKWHTINAGIEVNGTPILTAEADRTALFQTTESVASGRISSVPWKSPTGWIDATAEQMVPLRDAVELHMQCCFQREKALHSEIDSALQATDPHFTLSAIEWQAGWPETLSPEAKQPGGADVQ